MIALLLFAGPLAGAALLAATAPVARAAAVLLTALLADRVDRVRCLLADRAARPWEDLADAYHVVLIELINEWDGPARLLYAAHHEHLVAAL